MSCTRIWGWRMKHQMMCCTVFVIRLYPMWENSDNHRILHPLTGMICILFCWVKIMSINGRIIGYDPGGNGAHGVAELEIEQSRCVHVTVLSLETTEDVLCWILRSNNLVGLGVDTLAAWSTGPSGWRTADLFLRKRYTDIQKSIVSPNGLYGSMGINGMAVSISLRHAKPHLSISETHPKVLYRALEHKKYDYKSHSNEMDSALSRWIGSDVHTSNDHEWDAAVSAYAMLQGMTGSWTHDLFEDQIEKDGRLVWPCGKTNYWWPE
jgi:hypothetical protein